MRQIASLAAAIVLFCSINTAHAELDQSRMIALQSTLLSFLGERESDGRYVIFNTDSGELLKLSPASLHPKIVPFRNGYFLCADFVADGGTTYEVDFLVMPVRDGFAITQTLFDSRDSIRKTMGK
ncbi:MULTISPECIES: hypothetical protein [unclassified Minwuia]|uniref:hypothetical protein n=2 Tax=Minwuia TaxID=2493629 RepID=UPI002478E61C|nr:MULTISPECIES: hypothetical protein [unclassified Minwuia]